MTKELQQWVNSSLKWLASGGIVTLCTLLAFILKDNRDLHMELQDRPTAEEVQEAIKTLAPWNSERLVILEKLSAGEKSRDKLTSAIENNTQVMQEIKLVLAKMQAKDAGE